MRGKLHFIRPQVAQTRAHTLEKQAQQDIIHDERIHVLPFSDSIEGLSGHIFDVYFTSKLCDIPGSP
ncbi:hypothetical protein BDR03DRAFT_954470 [Suillus americanus]|nr:hypothetical protein BDR03DRAFT_954470 [Suillus americanus]